MAWQPAAPFPLARCACSAAVDRQKHRLCLFGGFDGKEVLAKDVFFMDYRVGCKSRRGWRAADVAGLLACTVPHASRVDHEVCHPRCNAADPRDWPWTAATPELPLAARFGGAACVHRGSFMLFGGVNALPKENIFFVKVLLDRTRSEDVSVGDDAGTGAAAPAAGAGAGAGSGSGAGAGAPVAADGGVASAAAEPKPAEAEALS